MLDPTTVGSPDFGRLFDATLDGQIYAQPLVAGGVVLVATETNQVYALEPATGAVLWSRDLGTPWNPLDLNCRDLVPSIGVTGTPAVDAATNTAYLVSKTYVSGSSGAAQWLAHALDLGTGAERDGFPVVIAGAASNAPSKVFDAGHQMQRPGLLLMNGVVYAAFGAHCDQGPYAGWVVGITTKGTIQTLWTTEAVANLNGAGIWQAGGGLISDGDGQILFATGNDWTSLPGPVSGRTPPATLGEAIVRLSVQPDGTLAATDFFSPASRDILNGADADIGSGAPVALPASFGSDTHRNLLVEAGKQGAVYLLDRDDLGGYMQGTAAVDRAVQIVGGGGVWSKPSVWPGDGGWLYLPLVSNCEGAADAAGCLRVYQRGLTSDGTPVLSQAGRSADSFGYGASAVVVTSTGTSSGSALLWTVWTSASGSRGWLGTEAQLRAYDAVPEGGTLRLRFLAGIGTSAKFTPPAVGAGRVYVGTRDGHVMGFGVRSEQPLRAQGIAFAPAVVGDTVMSTVHVTATTDVTIASLATSGDFSLAGETLEVPFSAKAGDSFDVGVAFHPSLEGPLVGALGATTNLGTFAIPLSGVGATAAPVLVATPSVVTFPPTPTGQMASALVTISNASASAVTITGVGTPSSPFAATGVPPAQTVLDPGAAVTVTITYAPSRPGSSSAYLSVGAGAAIAAVAVEGTALAGGRMRVQPATLDLGSVAVSTEAVGHFTVMNSGDAALTIKTSTAPTTGVFSADEGALPAGTVIAPGGQVEVTVRATPLAVGLAGDAWTLEADDGHPARHVTLAVTGSAVLPAASEALPSPTATSASPEADAPVKASAGCATGGGGPASLLAAAAMLAALLRARRARA
jgi:outer membrane protein assembly factor BamB